MILLLGYSHASLSESALRLWSCADSTLQGIAQLAGWQQVYSQYLSYLGQKGQGIGAVEYAECGQRSLYDLVKV